MAKLNDKLYNRTIVGKLEVEDGDEIKLTSLDLDGGITGKTLYQTEPNWSYTDEIVPPTPQSDMQVEKVFISVAQYNHKLNIVVLLKLTNPTENALTIYQVSAGTITFPSSIAEKLIDYDGKKVSETGSTAVVSGMFGYYRRSTQIISNTSFSINNSITANVASLFFNRPDGFVIGSGQSAVVEGRIELII